VRIGEFNGRRLHTGLTTWAMRTPTSASRAISAVAELFVDHAAKYTKVLKHSQLCDK